MIAHGMRAGAKAAPGAGQDRDFKVWISAKRGPNARQFQAHFMVQRIEPLRPVHAHHQNLPVGFGFNNCHDIPPSALRHDGRGGGG
jgi:hypothetical protein